MSIELRLQIFARHAALIHQQEADGKPREYYPCTGVHAIVTVTPAGGSFKGDSIWDNVEINGRHCGNRWGGLKAFTNLVNKVNPKIVEEFDEDHDVPMTPLVLPHV